MSIQAQIGGTLETALATLTNTTATVLVDNDDHPLLIHSVAYASAAGDTLTLYTNDGSTDARLRKVTISANADGAYEVPFVLARTHDLYAALATGNATSIRVTYTILNS